LIFFCDFLPNLYTSSERNRWREDFDKAENNARNKMGFSENVKGKNITFPFALQQVPLPFFLLDI